MRIRLKPFFNPQSEFEIVKGGLNGMKFWMKKEQYTHNNLYVIEFFFFFNNCYFPSNFPCTSNHPSPIVLPPMYVIFATRFYLCKR